MQRPTARHSQLHWSPSILLLLTLLPFPSPVHGEQIIPLCIARASKFSFQLLISGYIGCRHSLINKPEVFIFRANLSRAPASGGEGETIGTKLASVAIDEFPYVWLLSKSSHLFYADPNAVGL